MPRTPRPSAAAIALAITSIASVGCYAGIAHPPGAGDAAGTADDDGADAGTDDGDTGGEPGCEAAVPRFAARVPDRHVANAVASLLGVTRPELATIPGDAERFVPDQPSAVTGAVASKFQVMAEAAAAQATVAGAPWIACEGELSACADANLDELASRAFRRAATAAELEGLHAVYDEGVSIGGDHASGMRLAIEAILQSPSFLYEIEAPATQGDRYDLDAEQFAGRLALFLTDTVADHELWRAARDGELESDEQIASQVDRLLATPAGAQQLRVAYGRFFDLHRISELTKHDVDPALFAAMRVESEALLDTVLSRPGGSLTDLLLSREATVEDAALAELYGVAVTPPGQTVELPATERAGLLTRAGLMALESSADESSVIHRGLLVTRNLLCVSPPPPTADNVAQGQEINGMYETERERMLVRASTSPCAGCHRLFDPLGVAFEHYDRVGRYRGEIETSMGPVAIDSAWDLDLADVQAHVDDALQLSAELAASETVHACVTERFVGYALGRSLEQADRCVVEPLAAEFDASGGDLAGLLRAIALWPGLRQRTGGEP